MIRAWARSIQPADGSSVLVASAPLLDIGAGREAAPRTGDHQAPHARVEPGPLHGVVQLDQMRLVERVQRSGPVQRDDADAALLFPQDVLVFHPSSSLSRLCDHDLSSRSVHHFPDR